MKIKNAKNRMIATILCVAMIIGLIPVGILDLFSIRADAANSLSLSASQLSLGANVIPSGLTGDSNFMSTYVKTNGNSMNLNSLFTLQDSKNANNASNTLSYKTIDGKKESDWFVEYRWYPNQVQRQMLSDSRFTLVYEGKMTPHWDKHLFADDHWSTVSVRLSKGDWTYGQNDYGHRTNGEIIFGANSAAKSSGSAQAVKKSNSRIYVKDGEFLTYAAYKLWDRSCGDPSVGGSTFYFVENGNPTFTAHIEGGSYVNFGSASSVKGTLVMDFSENVRLADNDAKGDGLTVYLDAYYRSGSKAGTALTGDNRIAAKLVSINGNQMRFEFTVPAKINGNTDIEITGLSSNQPDLWGNFDLNVYNGSGSLFHTVKGGSTSAITDIAGNPASRYFTMNSKVVYDNVSPTVSRIDMTGNMISADSTKEPTSWEDNSVDLSAVFAGEGDTVGFQAYFSESITNANGVVAVLNITDESGTPLELGVKNVYGNCITFHDIKITKQMLKAGNRIYITNIEKISDIADYAGNKLVYKSGNASTSSNSSLNYLSLHAHQIYLDVDGPIVTLGEAMADANGGEYFTVPITIAEKTGAGQVSTVNDVPFSFVLSTDDGSHRGYYWYIDGQQSARKYSYNSEWWKSATTGSSECTYYTTSDSYRYYLHIYLDPDTNYGYTANGGMDENGVYFNGTVSVTAGDWAGNTSTNSRSVSHQVDKVKPNVGRKDSFGKNPVLEVDFTNGVARVTKDFVLTDNYCLENVTYTWYTRFNGETSYTAGTPYTLSGSQLGWGLVKQFSKSVTLEWDFDKFSDSKRVGDLYLEVTYEDRPGNTATIKSKPFAFNFTKATGHYEITTGEESKPILQPSIVLSAPTWTSTTLENTPRTLIFIPYSTNDDGTTNYWAYDPWNWDSQYAPSLPSGTWGSGSLNYTGDDLIRLLFTYYEEIRDSEENFQRITDYFPGRFYRLRGTIENDEGTFTSIGYDTCDDPESVRGLYSYIKNGYGTMEVLFVTTASLPQWVDDYHDVSPAVFADGFNFKAAETMVESFTLYLANRITYDVKTLAVTDAGGADAEALLKYVAGNTTAASLDDVQITFQLSNVSDASANYQYGFETIDFSQSKVELLSGTDEVLATWALKKTGDGVQSVILESGLCQETGWYRLRVTVRDAMTDTDQVFELDRYFMDTNRSELSLDTYYKKYEAEDEAIHIDSTFNAHKTELEKSYANGDEIILGLDTAPEGWLLDVYLEFTKTKIAYYGVTDLSKIRVTNVTYDEAYKAHLEAQELSYADTLSGQWIRCAGTDSFRYIPVFTKEFAEGAYNNMAIPMLEGYNLLNYQIQNTNGTGSSKQIAVYVYGKSVDWELDCTLESKKDGYINSATVTAVLPMDASFTLADCHFGYTTSNNYSRLTSYTFTDDLDTTEFFLLDAYGNLSLKKIAVTDENGELINIDGTGSEVYASKRQGTHIGYDSSGSYCLEVEVRDKEHEISPDDLFVIFDTYYSAVLQNVEVGTRHLNEEQVRVNIPFALNKDGTFRQNEDGTYPMWEGYDISNYGIYRTQVLQVGGEEEYTGYVRFQMWGTWKPDAELGNDENAPDRRTLTLASEDPYGNVGGYDCIYDCANPYVGLEIGTPVSIMHDMYDPYGSYVDRDAYAGQINIDASLTRDQQLGLYSSVPLLSLEGYGAGQVVQHTTMGQGQRVFATTAPMIIEDGIYTFTATDLFGQIHHLKLWVSDVFGELGITAVFSTTQPTNQDVTVTLQATGLQDKIISVTSGLGTVGTVDPADPRTASITVSENCSVTVLTEDGCERTVTVSNIDKVLGQARIVYYDAYSNVMTGNESQAWDEVIAVLTCDSEYIYATNGPDKYTFLPGDKAGDTYTFEYRDTAGNTGSITAVLPCDVVASPVPDTDAPEFRLNMYGMRFNTYEQLTEMKNPETGDEISSEIDGYKAQRFKFVLSIEDISATKVVVQPADQEAPTDYASVNSGSTVENVSLSVSGRSATLQITENTRFDVYIIDEADNVTALTDVVIGNVDMQAPELYADYEMFTDAEGASGVSVKFLPANPTEQLEIITPMSTDATSWLDYITGEDGETLVPITRYGYIFRDNGTYTFTYRDACGNIGSVSAEVKGLSNAAAVVKSVSWYGTKGNTTPEKSVPVNKDVVAELDMSKAISRVTLYKYDPTAENNKGELVNDANVSVSFTGTNVYVTYKGNVEYRIVAEFTAAESGRKGYYTLQAVLCIDKVAPAVRVTGTKLTENKRAMTVTFETDEPTLLSQNAAEGYASVHSWIAKTNAPQQLQFSDSTGNITVYQLTENSSVDTAYLTVHYSLTDSDADVTDEPLGLELDSNDAIYIKTNKAANVELAGVALGSIAANRWTKLTVPESAGIHILVLTDTNTGEVLYDVLSSVPKDNVPPVITLASSTVVVNEDASYEDMLAAIHGGVTVTDDKDGDINRFRITGYPNKVTAGLYNLTYHASDEAGNTSDISRVLYIMAEGTPLLLVNGEAALPFDKVVIRNGENISLQIQNFTGDRNSMVIKYRSGIKTAGQMKYSATTVENMSFSVTEPGHYTIYIRTQDRVEYVTYIYVEG